jgi:hypothetical protein
MLVSFLSIALNVGLNWFLAFHLNWGIAGLGFATGCVATVNFALLYCLMRRATGRLETRGASVQHREAPRPERSTRRRVLGRAGHASRGWESLAAISGAFTCWPRSAWLPRVSLAQPP